MPDNKSKIAPQDKKRIDIDDPNEVRNWSRSLGCTENELKDAVEAVGSSAEAVKRRLGKK